MCGVSLFPTIVKVFFEKSFHVNKIQSVFLSLRAFGKA